jgi:hypothetical protein
MRVNKVLLIISIVQMALVGAAAKAQATGWYESFEASSIDRNDYGNANRGDDNLPDKGSDYSEIFTESMSVTGSPDGGSVEPEAVTPASPGL